MKRSMLVYLSLLLMGSLVFGQVSSEQALEKLRQKQQQRREAATQPASREEVDDLWTEVNRLKNEVQGLREEVANLRKQLDFRDGREASETTAGPKTSRPPRKTTPPPQPSNDN